MQETERIIGELKEFKRATLDELKEIRIKVEELHKLKWSVAGGAALLSVLVTVVIEGIHVLKP